MENISIYENNDNIFNQNCTFDVRNFEAKYK